MLEANLPNFDTLWKMKLTFEIAYSYFGIGDHQQALDWINRLIHTSESSWQKGAYHIDMLNFLIHSELKNQRLLESIARGITSVMKGQKRGFEKMLIGLVKKVVSRVPKSIPEL